jgi:hypothetical protein
MKLLYQIVAATMLLLLLGVSGADCLVPNAGMSDAEKACCRQMAGQCDMNAAAKHPCCRKIVQRHDVANLNEPSHFITPALSLQAAPLGSGLSLDVSMPSFVLPERLRHPPPDLPTPSVDILRV